MTTLSDSAVLPKTLQSVHVTRTKVPRHIHVTQHVEIYESPPAQHHRLQFFRHPPNVQKSLRAISSLFCVTVDKGQRMKPMVKKKSQKCPTPPQTRELMLQLFAATIEKKNEEKIMKAFRGPTNWNHRTHSLTSKCFQNIFIPVPFPDRHCWRGISRSEGESRFELPLQI